MAVESLFAVDLIMNLSILLAVQLSLARLHFPSLFRALALMSVNTLLGRLVLPGIWSVLPVQAAVCILSGGLLLRSRNPGRMMTAALGIFCATASAAGIAQLGGMRLPAAVAGLCAFACLIYKRRSPAVRWNISVSVEKDGVSETFHALIDTGNRLTEHRSALPVMIAEKSALPRLSELFDNLSKDEIRILRFGVLGSGGELACFFPDRITLHADGESIVAPPCWLALFDGHIPGNNRALAPPEFADCICAGRTRLSAASHSIRRISYAIFNRQTVHLRPRCTDQARFGLLHRRQ